MELAPFHEDAFRRLLALLERTGDRAGAVHAYDKFAGELARELEVTPAPETRALIEAIRARVSPDLNPPDSLPPEPPRPVSAPISQRPRRVWWGVAASAVVIAVAGIALLPGKTLPVDPLRVDVAPLENRTGDRSLDRLAVLAADRMIEALRGTGLVKDVRLLARGAPGGNGGTLVAGALEHDGGHTGLRVWVTDVQRGGKAWEIAPIVIGGGPADSAIAQVRPRVTLGTHRCSRWPDRHRCSRRIRSIWKG